MPLRCLQWWNPEPVDIDDSVLSEKEIAAAKGLRLGTARRPPSLQQGQL